MRFCMEEKRIKTFPIQPISLVLADTTCGLDFVEIGVRRTMSE